MTKLAIEAIKSLALALYGQGIALPEARKRIAAKSGRTNLNGVVDPIYFREAGRAVPFRNARTIAAAYRRGDEAPLAAAVRARRDRKDGAKVAQGTPAGLDIVRWLTVAGSIDATIGGRASEAEAKRLYTVAGGDPEKSFTGRGTLAGAPKYDPLRPFDTDRDAPKPRARRKATKRAKGNARTVPAPEAAPSNGGETKTAPTPNARARRAARRRASR